MPHGSASMGFGHKASRKSFDKLRIHGSAPPFSLLPYEQVAIAILGVFVLWGIFKVCVRRKPGKEYLSKSGVRSPVHRPEHVAALKAHRLLVHRSSCNNKHMMTCILLFFYFSNAIALTMQKPGAIYLQHGQPFKPAQKNSFYLQMQKVEGGDIVNAVQQVSSLRLTPSESTEELPLNLQLKPCASINDIDCVDYEDCLDEFEESALRSEFRKGESENGLKTRKKGQKATNRSRPMMWIHIHKNAGTTMCALAHKNGEKVVTPHFNCNWRGHDQAFLTGKHRFTSCDTRQQKFADQGATWGQIEREVHSDDFCEGFEYGIMLRDPVEHAVSSTRFDHIDVK